LSRTQKAIREEQDKFKNLNELEKKTRVHWQSVYKYDAKSIQAAAKAVVDEKAAIAGLDLVKMQAVNEAIGVARRYLADQNIELAEAAVTKAVEASGRSGSSNAISKLKADISKLKTELSKKKGANRIYGNASALTGTSTETDDRVAKAMEEAAKDKAEKKDTTAAQPGLTMGSKSGTVKAKTESKPKSHSSSSDEDTKVSAPEDSGIQKYLIIGGGALLAILLGVLFLKKK